MHQQFCMVRAHCNIRAGVVNITKLRQESCQCTLCSTFLCSSLCHDTKSGCVNAHFHIDSDRKFSKQTCCSWMSKVLVFSRSAKRAWQSCSCLVAACRAWWAVCSSPCCMALLCASAASADMRPASALLTASSSRSTSLTLPAVFP